MTRKLSGRNVRFSCAAAVTDSSGVGAVITGGKVNAVSAGRGRRRRTYNAATFADAIAVVVATTLPVVRALLFSVAATMWPTIPAVACWRETN
jgi:hypothetical protein